MTTTTEMQLVDINKLIPYVNNARTHSPEQITKLRSSLREFGFVNPIIVDKDLNVIAGHGRLAAAKAEGITEVPCVFAEHLTEAQKKAYIIADNRMSEDAGWDDELLKVEMEALQDMGFDLSMTGFDESELADLFGEEKDTEDDDFDVDKGTPRTMISMLIKLSKEKRLFSREISGCLVSTDFSAVMLPSPKMSKRCLTARKQMSV